MADRSAIRGKILVIDNSVAVTGAFESVLRSSLYLSDQFEFIFLLPDGSAAQDELTTNKIKNYTLPMKELRQSVSSIVLYLPMLLLNGIRLRALVKREKIDIILCNDFYNLLPVVQRLFFQRTRYVCYVRFLPSKFPKLLVKIWFHLHELFAEKIIAVSNAVRAELPLSKNVVVIHNELPTGNSPYISSHSHIILYPANYISGKGQNHAIEAFATIHRLFPEWKLRFVGGDMGLQKNRVYKAQLQELCKTQGITHQVEFAGFSSHIAEEYLRSELVLNFSESESFSLTCLEAMYYGRPVIASRCGGPEEIVSHRSTGWLVPNRNVEAMRKAMLELLGDSELRKRIGSTAYSECRVKFSHVNTGDRLRDVYKECLEVMY